MYAGVRMLLQKELHHPPVLPGMTATQLITGSFGFVQAKGD